MYYGFYCLNPNDTSNPLNSNHTYSDEFPKLYNKILDNLDQFIYLLDTYTIIKDCFNDFSSFETNSNNEKFWKINKLLFNYVNSVYIFKEFANNYSHDTELKIIINNYYKKDKWFRFICDYRNAVIHQFSIIKDIGKNDEYFLNIDELVKVLNKSSKNRKKDKNKIEFANKLKTKYYHYYVDSNQTCYLNLTEIIKNVDHEITELYEELVDKAYKKYVKPNIIKLIEYCYKKNNIYFYTFIINQNDKNDYL